jgi:hypothetical protein
MFGKQRENGCTDITLGLSNNKYSDRSKAILQK